MPNCLVCGNEIKPARGESKVRRSAKYCSDECRKKAQYKYAVRYVIERKKVDPEFREDWNRRNKIYKKRSAERKKSENGA